MATLGKLGWEPAALTSGGRASLADNETQVATASGVHIQNRNKKCFDGRENGNAIVTTLFIWWWKAGGGDSGPIKLGLQHILKAELHNSLFRREPRIDLYFAHDPSEPLVRIVFTGSESAEFFQRLQNSISRQGWKAPKTVVKREEGFKTQYAGVGGVMQRQQQKREQTDALASEAFSDLSALLTSASEIVKLADRFSAGIKANKDKTNVSEEDEFFSLLNDMGIANPATKRACGSKYHEELARELNDFLDKHLKRHSKSGVIALTDLYCLVNRARGTELISPNDLYQACSIMENLNLNFYLKEFPSGVAVLQSISLNDDAISNSLLDLLHQNEQEASDSGPSFLTALSVAQEKSISLQLAMEQLKTAESLGHLCRDSTIQGVAFYRNLFLTF